MKKFLKYFILIFLLSIIVSKIIKTPFIRITHEICNPTVFVLDGPCPKSIVTEKVSVLNYIDYLLFE